MRYAIYVTPPANDPLTRLAARWLGRDAFADAPLPHPEPVALAPNLVSALTAQPRRYGFHATLKAPFRLQRGVQDYDLIAALTSLASEFAPVVVPSLRVNQLGDFFALTPVAPTPDTDRLAAYVVEALDPFRAELNEEEFAGYRAAGLTPHQQDLLRTWGYPYVFDAFRFHMSLTGPVAKAERAVVYRALENLFAPVVSHPLVIDRLHLFVEQGEGGNFRVRFSARLGAHGAVPAPADAEMERCA
ncbi:MAG: DUF1045 domain-containing protein [Hyphomicrobiales bacterium]|nr:DUF1045 domain-containing protein [Hyphomicrobiales bacterium]